MAQVLRLCSLIGVTLHGCASTPVDAAPHGEDWREAEIIEIELGGSITQQSPNDCRTGLPREWVVGNKYAVLTYRVDRAPRYRIVPIVNGATLKVGDLVYVNIRDCWARLIPRTAASPSAKVNGSHDGAVLVTATGRAS